MGVQHVHDCFWSGWNEIAKEVERPPQHEKAIVRRVFEHVRNDIRRKIPPIEIQVAEWEPLAWWRWQVTERRGKERDADLSNYIDPSDGFGLDWTGFRSESSPTRKYRLELQKLQSSLVTKNRHLYSD
jgi:hypothetical protein